MIKSSIEKIGDIIILQDKGRTQKSIILEGIIKREYIGFSFYEEGAAIIYNKGNQRIGTKNRMSWSTFFVSPEFGNIFREIVPKSLLSQLTILYPFEMVKNRFIYSNHPNSSFRELLQPGEIYVDVKQKIAPPALFQPSLKILNCTMINPERELYLESQCLEILSQISFQLRLENTPVNLTMEDMEKLEKVKIILMSNFHQIPSLNELSQMVGMNIHSLKDGFKLAYGTSPFKWLTEQKLVIAYTKLLSREYTSSEVCYLLGYSSVNTFNNTFYKKFGIRPGNLKKNSPRI